MYFSSCKVDFKYGLYFPYLNQYSIVLRVGSVILMHGSICQEKVPPIWFMV